jgi:diphthine-ammonia ligase
VFFYRLQELRYKKTIGDEVEDLEKLLVAEKQKHADIQAASSGAIASNYQRLRVESICSRLGLMSLALHVGARSGYSSSEHSK